jgi:hypothetical protein
MLAESATRHPHGKYHNWPVRGISGTAASKSWVNVLSVEGAHHGDVRGHLRDNRQAVRNQNVGATQFTLQFLQQQKHLRTHGDVQRGNGLIRAPTGSIPIKSSDNIVFRLPDSPTNPTHSLAPIRSDNSFTGRTHPAAVGDSTATPRIWCSSLASP